MPVSYQAQSPVLGLVLPSNSPGVHTLWLPIIPMQIGLVLKPGPQEPWTPYRMAAAFIEAGIPREAISIYPGGGDVGAAVLDSCDRSLIFGGTATVERYHGNPRVQAHGPGFSKILLGDDVVDHWEKYLDMMVDSVFINSGRGCINCSGIWACRHTRRSPRRSRGGWGRCRPLPPDDPKPAWPRSPCPAWPTPSRRRSTPTSRSRASRDVTAKYRDGAAGREEGPRRLPAADGRALRIARTRRSPRRSTCSRSSTVVECPQEKMLEAIGPTLVCSAITGTTEFRERLIDAVHIDRLNLGPVPTIQLNWLQPHEGNIVDFLFRARAFQTARAVPYD